ncbi:MAG: hypothetical protein JKX85_05820, partial [Phycisphaeraceae bacterium]|nr:hypothetical protein [Phycisphaeraceae bacterium]
MPAKPAIVIDAKTILGPVNRKVFGQVVRGADRKDVFTDTHDQYITNQSEGMWDPEHRRPSTNAIAFLKGVNPTILRYPDGLNTQGHDWKKTVGPISERPNFQFGLDEYMQVCKAAGAQAQIVVTEYIGTTQDLADMVEYLNMPATAKYPWAQKRVQWGHVEPYGVKYFELGNESWVKKLKGRGAERHNEYTYAKYAKDAIVAMKKVDPTIQIGVVLMNYPVLASHPWNKQVLGAVGDLMDFGITHTYCVGYKGNDMDVDEDRILSAVLPASEQLEYWLRELRHRIYKETGRNIPLAITEFNGMFVQNKPKQYIHSYAPAFFNAEYLRILLKPENNIILANFWQFFNSYFGMVQGKTDESLLAMPAYPLFRLWADHFGDLLIKVDVRGEPRVPYQGFGHTAPAKGDRYQPAAAVEGGDLLSQGIPNLNVMPLKWNGKIKKQGPRSLTIQLDQVTKIRYPNLFKVQLPKVLRPTQGAVQYQISFEMRFVSDTNQPAKVSLGLGISDGRGWTKQIH